LIPAVTTTGMDRALCRLKRLLRTFKAAPTDQNGSNDLKARIPENRFEFQRNENLVLALQAC
jgi:hypothetical protein